MNQFDRSDVLRILRITARQLSGWQRAGLVASADVFSFFDLLQVKKIRDLRAKRVKSATILASLQAMQRRVAGMENPLLEASSFNIGTRIAFRTAGRVLDPIDGQFVLDFSPSGKVLETTRAKRPRAVLPVLPDTVADLFARGVSLEEDILSVPDAIRCYKSVLEIDASYAPAHINLGTLYYNQSDYELAEQHYRKAVEADPRYALAYFDLGNVLDETQRVNDAINAYKSALQLAPTYADAHYNLALAYERSRQPRLALKHWRAYLKLDGRGPWAIHARAQYHKLLDSESLKLVSNR
ncbi:MAG: tetratricopeptide repeat protein [Acidobacteriota bacterium]|nr:tetratricopeptide repeat protein [Acidobacteriota bacterium]